MGQYFDLYGDDEGGIMAEFIFNAGMTRFGITLTKREGEKSGWWFVDGNQDIMENGNFTHEEMLKLKEFFKDY